MSAGICGFEIFYLLLFFFGSRFGVEMHDSRLRLLGSNPGVPVESVKFVVSGFFPSIELKKRYSIYSSSIWNLRAAGLSVVRL